LTLPDEYRTPQGTQVLVMTEKQAIDTDEYAGMHVPHTDALTNQSFAPLEKHDLDKVQESHGIFDHSDGRLVVDPEEAKIEVKYIIFDITLPMISDAILASYSTERKWRPS
jgi:hypothetical protein